jgi:hypothetical protein
MWDGRPRSGTRGRLSPCKSVRVRPFAMPSSTRGRPTFCTRLVPATRLQFRKQTPATMLFVVWLLATSISLVIRAKRS